MKNSEFRMVFSVLAVMTLALLLSACGGSKTAKTDENITLIATMQAQQATIAALQAAPTQPPAEQNSAPQAAEESQPDPSLQATMDAQQNMIVTLQAGQANVGEATELAPVVNPGGSEIIFETDFTTDEGHFILEDKDIIEKDALFMGPFEKCSDFSLEIDRPVGCLAICKTCGIVSEYDERVEITYADGLIDRMWGLVLRFNDMNGNNLIDREDYFLGWAYNAYPSPNASYLFEHIPADFAGWHTYGHFPRHLRGKQDKPTIIRVISWKEGHRIMIYMNDTLILKIQNEEKIPGKDDEIFLGKRKEISDNWDGMPNDGKIGFWVTDRKVKLKYDNYTFSNRPEEPTDW